MKIIFSLLGAYFGALLDGFEGAVYGFFIGFLGGALINANTRFRRLEQQLQSLGDKTRPDSADTGPEQAPETPAPAPEPVDYAPSAGWQQPDAQPAETPQAEQPAPSGRPVPEADDPVSRGLRRLFSYLAGGNPLVKIGVVVLFFGVSFLVKFTADAGMLPIELRLAGPGRHCTFSAGDCAIGRGAMRWSSRVAVSVFFTWIFLPAPVCMT